MNILITGANGFIGGYLVAHLLKQGHNVRCAVRDVAKIQQRFPLATAVSCDFNQDVQMDTWIPRLESIDAVINCAGILRGSGKQDIERIHYAAPLALFKACEQVQIKRVIQISALGVANGPNNEYVNTKKKLDDALMPMNLSACILRPSLIYASGAYGGTALLRALASLPFGIPMMGTGESRFQPVAMCDLVKIIAYFLNNTCNGVINIVSERHVSIRQILVALRQWLGFAPRKTYSIPLALIKPLCRLGDTLGRGPLNSVSLQMMQHENIADAQPLNDLIDFKITPFPEGLNYYPSQTQDRWHARLYFLRPLLKASLIVLWLFSGLVPLLGFNQEANHLLSLLGYSPEMATTIKIASCWWDILLGAALLFSFKNRLTGFVQLLTVTAYTLVAGIGLPSLWLNPLAPLLKNIPVAVAILVWMAIEDMR